ncbi:MAG: hypothetical protein IIC39_10240 [Candidatus Marinimicrobia bacterium]|nr:hypothetical protein [Candidatus Neomarinimicrobiota bacterium]
MEEILKDVYTWSVFSPEKGFNFNGWFILKQNPLFGNVVIDPPQPSDDDLTQIRSLGGVSEIIITNRDHVRWSRELKNKFDATIRMPSADAGLVEIEFDSTYDDGDALAGFLQAVHIPNNKSPGETALYWQHRKILILGDALIGEPPGDVSLLPSEKYDDIILARNGISVLVELDFDALLLSDGQPILKGGKIAVKNFVEGN